MMKKNLVKEIRIRNKKINESKNNDQKIDSTPNPTHVPNHTPLMTKTNREKGAEERTSDWD